MVKAVIQIEEVAQRIWRSSMPLKKKAAKFDDVVIAALRLQARVIAYRKEHKLDPWSQTYARRTEHYMHSLIEDLRAIAEACRLSDLPLSETATSGGVVAVSKTGATS